MALNIPQIPLQLPLPRTLPTDLDSALAYIKALIEVLQQQNSLIARAITSATGSGALANRPPTPPNGSLYWDGTHFYVFDGTNWQTLV